MSFVTSAGRVALTPRRLPRLDNVPKYMTWAMATENTLVQARECRAFARRPALTRYAQEKVQRRLLYADKEGEMIPGTDDSDAEAPVRTSVARARSLHAHVRRTDATQVEDSADQRAWSRQEDFLILGVAAQLGSSQVRPTPFASPPGDPLLTHCDDRRSSTSSRRCFD